MLSTKIPACFSIVLLSLVATCLFSIQTAESAAEVKPDQLYHQAWLLVRDKYYDSHYAGNDWNSWEHKYDGQLATTKQAEDAISFMLGKLGDPYTRLLGADEYKKEHEMMHESKMVGIGLILEPSADKEHLMVAQALDGSPAYRAGINSGEELLAIDGQAVSAKQLDQCRQKIVGDENTTISLLLSDKDGKIRKVDLKREHLELHSVSTANLDSNIGYIKLSSFLYGDATAEFQEALTKLSNKDGLILDMRHNPGGQTFNALGIADMLLDRGVIVRTIDRRGAALDVSAGHPISKQPLVVLVDHDSASASEILAAALQDHNRGAIVGTRTYGKGLVQEIEPLPGGGALHLTIAQFMSPNGSKINHVGITPEIEVNTPEEQMKVAVDVLKSKIAAANQPRRVVRHEDLNKKRT